MGTAKNTTKVSSPPLRTWRVMFIDKKLRTTRFVQADHAGGALSATVRQGVDPNTIFSISDCAIPLADDT